MRTTFLFILCSLFFTANNAMGQETYQLDELEVTLPKGYSGHSRMMDGALNTGFSKKGNSRFSQLIVTVSDLNNNDLGEDFTEDILVMLKDDVAQPFFAKMGLESGNATEYTLKKHRGFKAEGTGTFYGQQLKIVLKCILFSHYMVMFQEWYGDDNSADYQAIENSLRISSNNGKLSGMQTISYEGYSFDYDADKLMASTKIQDNCITFYFSCKDANYGDSFLEYNFTSNKTDNLYGDANNWLDNMANVLPKLYASIDLKPMEKATFLGKSGYMRTGYGSINLTGQKVKFTFKVCNYNGYFTTGSIQQSLNANGQVPKEIDELFKAVEASLKYSSK